MAAETAPTPAAAVVPAAAAAPRGGLRSRKFKILALLLVVLTVEAAGVYMLLPAPGGAATGAEEATETEADAEPHADEHHHGVPSETVEVPIDPPFNITNSRAVPGSIIHVSFHLVAVVAGSQEAAFTDAVNVVHNARVRQAIVMVMRSCSMADLGDPELGIREEINKVLRKSYVSEVVISDFKTLEH
jgi:flagellar basal body-associated protein FliL